MHAVNVFVFYQALHVQSPITQFSSYPRCTLHDDFGKYLADRQFCDVQFVIGLDETKISAHIAMVAARSPFLRAKIL